jgi:hypothetical protein
VPDPETLLSERATRQAIQGAHRRLSRLVETLYDIACGKDIKMFILVRHQSAHLVSYPKLHASDQYHLPVR